MPGLASAPHGKPGTHAAASRPPLRIALIAGEASGDQLGAGLLQALARQWPQAQFAGVGGPGMARAGMELWSDYSPLAVMGLAEVLRHLPRLLRFRRQLVGRLRQWQPDLFIGIDAPDFNLGVEKRLKRAGIRTVHYVSPSVWAWRAGRTASIAASTDKVLCLFPMEPALYHQHGVQARFVGHPMADRFPLQPDRAQARQALAVPAQAPLLAVLPGSRQGEIRRLLPVFVQVCRQLLAADPALHILLPAANDACREQIARLLADVGKALEPARRDGRLRLLDGQAHQALVAADAALLASGTAALEAALAKCPMLVAYRVSGLTRLLVRATGLLKVERFSLPNVLHDGPLVPEFIQDGCTPEAITPALQELLRSPAAQQRQIEGFKAIHRQLLAPQGASVAAAVAVADLLAPGAAAGAGCERTE